MTCNTRQVGWDAAKGLGIPEVPRHGWLVFDFVKFPRQPPKSRIGWGYRPGQHNQNQHEGGGTPSAPADYIPERGDEGNSSVVMACKPVCVEPVPSMVGPHEPLDSLHNRERMESRVKELATDLRMCKLEHGPVAMELWAKEV
eukprot:scaffold344674_cov46-Prasinocladus_malaysianus.AAC.1